MSQNLEIVRHFYEDSSAEFTNTECSKGEILQELCMIRPVDNAEKSEHNYDHEGNIQASWLSASEETGSMSDQTVHENRPISFITSNQVNLNNLSLPLVISNTNCVRSETDAFNNDNKVKSIANSSANSTDLSSEVLWNISTSDGSMSDISTESNPISEGKELENIEEQFVITGKDKTTDMDNSFLLEKYKNEALELRNSLERLNLERARLEVEASHSACLSQIEQQRREIELFKQERELDKRTQTTMKLEMDTFKKQYESANKEKEATVMRYAVSEMEVINQRKERENAEKKFKEALKEKEGLTLKLKNAMIEKARVSLLLDNKCSELANAQKDVEKLKEELNSKDIKIKWTQNKLKTEMDSYKESQSQVEKLSSKIQEAKEEVERAKKDADSAIKQFQFSQENKAYVLEQQLKELQAQLIMERHNLKDTDHNNKQLMHEVDALRNKHLLLIDEDNALKLKVSSLEKEKQDNEQLISRLRESMEKSSLEVDQLQEKTCNLDNLKLQLQQERDKVAQLQTEMTQLRTSNEELVNDMVSCREREAGMLEFTQKVTAKNVRLQSEYSCIEAKTRQLEFAEEPLQKKIDELSKELEKLRNELKKEQSDRTDEKKIVARHLAEKTATIEKLTKEIEDLKGENQVMKHKHSATLRELNREMLQCRKRLEQFENSSGSESLCHGSRASSYNSLNESSPTSVNSHGNIQFEPDKQAMVDRILRLQRENNRLREKIDFLEEHCKQLTMEMQKKTRVLQGYILREEAGTLSSGSMDSNKAEFAKYGGIMASVYGSKAVDDTMTLELSLEINHKLQAVLEDTLLKNITLKENIDTLGDEIRRLSRKS